MANRKPRASLQQKQSQTLNEPKNAENQDLPAGIDAKKEASDEWKEPGNIENQPNDDPARIVGENIEGKFVKPQNRGNEEMAVEVKNEGSPKRASRRSRAKYVQSNPECQEIANNADLAKDENQPQQNNAKDALEIDVKENIEGGKMDVMNEGSPKRASRRSRASYAQPSPEQQEPVNNADFENEKGEAQNVTKECKAEKMSQNSEKGAQDVGVGENNEERPTLKTNEGSQRRSIRRSRAKHAQPSPEQQGIAQNEDMDRDQGQAQNEPAIVLAEDLQAEIKPQMSDRKVDEEGAGEKKNKEKTANKMIEDKTTDDEKLLSQRMSESTAHDAKKSSNNNAKNNGNDDDNRDEDEDDETSGVEEKPSADAKDIKIDKGKEVAKQNSPKKQQKLLASSRSKSRRLRRYPTMSEKEERKYETRQKIDKIVESKTNYGLTPNAVQYYLEFLEDDIAMCQAKIDHLNRQMRKKPDLDQFELLTYNYRINEMALTGQLNELDKKILAMHSGELNTPDHLAQLDRLVKGKARLKKSAVSDLGNIADEITKLLEEVARMSTLRRQSTVKRRESA